MTDLQLLALHHRVACQGAARRTRLPEGFLPLAAEGLPAGGAAQQQGDGHQFEPGGRMRPALHQGLEAELQRVRHHAGQGASFHTDEVEPVTALFGDLFQSYVQDALCDGHFVHSAPMLAQSPRRVKGFGKSCHSAQIM